MFFPVVHLCQSFIELEMDGLSIGWIVKNKFLGKKLDVFEAVFPCKN